MKRLASFIQYITRNNPNPHHSLMSALLLFLLFIPVRSFAAYSNHSASIVKTISSNYNASISGVSHTTAQLVNPIESTYYYSGTQTDDKETAGKVYLYVTFKEEIDINDSDDLVVYLKRPVWTNNSNVDYAHPIEFEVKGVYGDKTHTLLPLFKVHFQYRGPLTEEYSVRIPIKEIYYRNPSYTTTKFTGLRFEATRNYSDGKFAARENRIRDVALNSFDVLKIHHDAPYSDAFIDNFHLNSDYGKVFDNFQFINTQGIADFCNKIDGWNILDESEIARLEGMGIKYPDYSFITSSSNKKRNPYPLNSDQKRQPTHTVEHIIYAMPGDVIPLYPYYGLMHTGNFKENFSHWYEYKSGKIPEYTTPWSGEKVDLLDFLVDPSKVQKTSGNGFFGGIYMNSGEIIKISTPQEYADAVTTVNNGKYDAIIELTADIDFSGFDGNNLIICPGWEHKFAGHINGNGHRISNLVVDKPEQESLGLLVGWTNPNVIIENIYIDNTCRITAKRNVGLIGFHAEQGITIRNIHTEATIKAVNGQAGGIIGQSDKKYNYIVMENCYIGGEVGIEGQFENAAIAGWWNTYEGTAYSSLKNVVVNCKLNGTDGNSNRKYFRTNCSSDPITDEANGVKRRGFFSYKDCYGNLDRSDKTWNYTSKLEFSEDDLAKLGWTDYKTPPMSATVTNPHATTITIGDEDDYITKIKSFNATTKDDNYKVTIVLTQDLDFKNYRSDEVPMIGESSDHEFAGIFNGAGHVIKNLRIIRDRENVGMFGLTRNGARIENLILDSSCFFQGQKHVGIVGSHRWNPIIFKNVKTEATVSGTAGGEQACAALVGFSNGGYSVGSFDVTDVYIGGVVGNPDDPNSHNNAIICGWQTNSHHTGTLTFTNVVVDCDLYGNQNQNRMKYMRHNFPDADITMDGDTYVRACINGDGNPYSFRYTNCFGNIDPTETPWQTIPVVTDETKLPEFETWTDLNNPGISGKSELSYLLRSKGDRKVGTIATFYCPRDPFDKQLAQSLPLPDGSNEYVIAADFSQTFSQEKNIDQEKEQLIEPIIAFRHIFRIRDGKEFADVISGSVPSNSNYLRTVRKYVSARTGEAFQIRLENPVPKKNGSKIPPSHYYYKDSDGEYRQVALMGIRVLNADTRKETSKTTFKFDNVYPGYGFREIDGVKYALGEGSFLSEGRHPDYAGSDAPYHSNRESEYYLLLTNKSTPQEGHYLVQIIAQDYDENIINIAGTSTPLVLMEFDITILPKDGAWMVLQDELYNNEKYSINSPEELDRKYPNQSFKIDFDEYMAINALPDSDPLKSKLISRSTYVQENGYISKPGPDAPKTSNGMDKTWFKWPRSWEQSTYIFGYNDRFDYSMYQVATHSDNVVWKEVAMEFPEATDPASMKGNNPGDGKGLFDRRYYASKLDKSRTADPKQGYFYYVNAASDPGVAATLEIPTLCQGSRIVVSAWMSEFSRATEKGNISFNFVAVLNDDVAEKYPNSGFENSQNLVLHKFITGYPADRGKWYNIYYSFFPRLAEFSSEGVTMDMVDHYELQLDNNSRSSNGADYAIDDIRAYVVSPTVDSRQLSPVCNNEKVYIRLASPFETLLEISQNPEVYGDSKGEELNVYYTFLKKDKFDAVYQNGAGDYSEAFNKSVQKFDYCIGDGKDRLYGKIMFNSKFSSNEEYEKTINGEVQEPKIGKAYVYTENTGERFVVFKCEVEENVLKPGSDYYVIFKSQIGDDTVPDENDTANVPAYFDMLGDCANTCTTFIIPTNVIKLDGEIQSDIENLIICENQSPAIQVDVWGVNEEGEGKRGDPNAYFDWFYGSELEFYNYNDGNPTHTLKDALTIFRLKYPKAENLVGIEPEKEKIEDEEWFEQWMFDIIKKASTQDWIGSTPRLSLYLTSFNMPPISLPENVESIIQQVVVVPIACIPASFADEDNQEYLICSDPTPLSVTVGRHTPLLRHGLTDKSIGYPEDLDDVPLRIGIDQLRSENSNYTGFISRTIDIPVRKTESSDRKSSKKLKIVKEGVHYFDKDKNVIEVEKDGPVVLLQTNDPEYKDLGTLDKDGNDIGSLMWVGDIKRLNATTNKEDAMQYFQVEFDNSFNFKEGYFYKFRFQFEEEKSEDYENVCNGQNVFTIKVVPKYVAWTGAYNINWNNDANWRRVAGDGSLSNNDLELTWIRTNQLAHYVTNGSRNDRFVNSNTMAYAPLDFTNVIVGAGMESPFMYSPGETKVNIKDEYDSSKKYSWPSDPEKGMGRLQEDDPGADGVGKVSHFIHYDMAAFEFDPSNKRETAEIGCRPWYANTCNEIHFKPGGTIMNQQELFYKKAWVDVELDPSRWYTLSLPLQEVFAGDFYLPSDGARQVSELYQPINFSTAVNNRFKPAVYQRGWDKSMARVYEIGGPAVDAPDVRNVAIRTFWSHVYNDVTEQYGNGTGFSVKTDVSGLSGSQWTAGNRVLFRFPKADDTFLYYNKDGDKSGHSTTISRNTEKHYSLNSGHGTLTARAAENGHYFLVGNPFMTHMDIQKFLDSNKDLLEQKYWIVTAKGQIAGSITEEGIIAAVPSSSDEVSYADDPSVIPPMQGFFVKSKDSNTTLDLAYDESMMRHYDSSGKSLTSTSRGEGSSSTLKISSYNYGDPSSAALLVVNDMDCSDTDVMAMDNRDLDVLSTVYTAKAGNALSINFSHEAEGTEIGVIADDDVETVIRFEGVDTVAGLQLLDKRDRTLTPLEEGMEMTVNGSAAGRYFLTYGIADEGVMSGIEWNVSGGVLTAIDNAASGLLEMKVYDTVGRLAKQGVSDSDILSLPLEHGIFVVEIKTAKERKSIKVRI